MKRLILMLVLVWTSVAQAKTESCSWDNDVPCVVITKPNTNLINEKVSPSTVITQEQIKKHNLVDLKSIFKFLNNTIAVQSGPRGQQASVFMRGTNSNHTLVLLNGIPINDQSTTNGAFDFGQDFMFNVQRVEVYKGAAGAFCSLHIAVEALLQAGAPRCGQRIHEASEQLEIALEESRTITCVRRACVRVCVPERAMRLTRSARITHV